MPTTATIAKTGLGLTAVFPWAWNFYIATNGWGPEMTAEVAGSVAVIVTSLLNRIEGA